MDPMKHTLSGKPLQHNESRSKMEEGPWEEALDIDDTDITSASSLRPCTTHLHSSKHASLSHSQLPLPLPLPPTSPLSPLSPAPPSPPASRRSIPGPAGAIQAALHRMAGFESSSHAEVSTQEYIRRVDEDSGLEFSRHPWLFALNVLRRQGGVDSTPLSDVKKRENAARIDKVVALVKSCKPNGLGDMMITLKDPTDSIGASVHRKVLTTGEFRRSLTVGSVLILHKVVVFTSPCSSCYLNITKNNVVKVITVECGVQSLSERNLIATPEMPQTTLGLTSRKNGVVIGDAQPGYHLEGMAVIQKLMGKEKFTQTSSLVNGKKTDIAANKYREDSTHVDLVNPGEYRYGNTSLGSIQPRSVSAEGLARNLDHLVNSMKGRQTRVFSSAPPAIDDLENRHVGDENGGQTSSMIEKLDTSVVNSCGISSTTAEYSIGCGSCEANDQKQSQDNNISSPVSMVESLAKENMFKVNDSQKRRQHTNPLRMDERHDHREDEEENGVKKQRLALISRSSVQEWTDEQLDILDMDED